MKKLFSISLASLAFLTHSMTAKTLEAAATTMSNDCVTEILSKRFSGYEFDGSKSVSLEKIHSIVEAGRLAPSSYNEQPWNFIICDKITNPAAYQKALSTLVEFNQGWAKNAPVLVIVVASTKSSHKDVLNRHGQYDTGAATFGMMIQATSLGLMTHQMGGFDAIKVKKLFEIPENFVPMSVMGIGYPAETQKPTERKRRPVEENFFDGSWGKPLK